MSFIRYIAIQLFAYCIDIGGFLALIYLGVFGPIISNIPGKIAAGFFAFIAHRSFTFRLDKNNHNRKQMYRYFLLLGLNVPVSSVMLALVLLIIDNSIFAKLLSDAFIVIFSFWLSKSWVFVPSIEGNDISSHKRIVP